tara:strand:- start:6729 stop:7166 length:438 start_codon:yes stop_codon:yes gene_type:complete
MNFSTVKILKGFGSLATGLLLASVFAPAAGASTLGVFVVAIGYAMLLLASIGNVLDVRHRHPYSSWVTASLKAASAIMAHLSAGTFLTSVGHLLVIVSAPAAVSMLVLTATLLLLSVVISASSVGFYLAYRHCLAKNANSTAHNC